ncbi:MAG: sigma-70 family RNA polymerase sigma factor [Armatimonadota bacterium]|nr:sigma-70 family RNA polymerase sigma factor [Armatimonadota bacterium]
MIALGIAHQVDADDILVLRFQEGERAAFEELALRYRDRIFNYLRAMCGSDSEAEDLTQEAFIRAFVNAKSFRRESSFHTWLYRIAYNGYLDGVRKQKRRPSISLDQPLSEDEEGTMDLPDPAEGPHENVERLELQSVLVDALQTLPEKLRSVVILHDVHGYSYEEIAVVVKCPLGTVRSRLFHARQKLRRKLSGYFREG